MSAAKRTTESSMEPLRIGRIVSLNMPSEEKGLNYDSLLQDLTKANDSTQQHFDCGFWACAAVRG